MPIATPAPLLRRALLLVWAGVLVAMLALVLFDRGGSQHHLEAMLASSGAAVGAIYLLLGSVRGFTLVPAAYLVLAGAAVMKPVPLWLLTLAGIAVSSTCIYFFSDALDLGGYFERRHPRELARLHGALQRHEFGVIVAWSFFPLAPTDLICYVCGALRLEYRRMLLGVMLGEGAICALYIGGAHWLLLHAL